MHEERHTHNNVHVSLNYGLSVTMDWPMSFPLSSTIHIGRYNTHDMPADLSCILTVVSLYPHNSQYNMYITIYICYDLLCNL